MILVLVNIRVYYINLTQIFWNHIMHKLRGYLRYYFNFNLLDRSTFLNENYLRRASAVILCGISIALLLTSIVLNLYEGYYSIIPPLFVSLLAIASGLCWMRHHNSSLVPLMITSITLMLLGAYLLLVQGAIGGGSFFWFLLYPPMVIFCLGLRNGIILCAIFHTFLLLVFVTPLSSLICDPPPSASRFLLTMLGISLFSIVVEYVRANTQKALINAINRLEREAMTDSLTGLGNRREFRDQLDWLQAQAIRAKQPFSIAMADIDHFKKVNDDYGHDVGDHVLRHVARLMSGNLRAADRIFRWGGEEFAILMPATSLDEASLTAERLRVSIEKNPFINDDGRIIPLSISIGIHCGAPEQPVDDQVKFADINLYKAKNLGRNRIFG